MYRIGEFSALSKTTIKTLRYYEKEGLIIPRRVDEFTGYRYYDSSQLDEVARIVNLRKLGFSIKDIKRVLSGAQLEQLLNERLHDVEAEIENHKRQLAEINRMIKEINMSQEIITKKLTRCTVYYKEGIIKDYSELTGFIIQSGAECQQLNPSIKCVQPDYCFVNYLDGQYKEKDIKVRYAQAVVPQDEPFAENESIKFKTLEEVNAVCIYHKGAYDELGKSYSAIMKHIEENGFEIADFPRERYIDGVWNKDDVNEWLTEIQVPIK